MKLQISFDLTDLDKAILIAREVQEFTDILEIGTLLIYAHGVNALKRFREAFADATLLVNTKIVDRGKESATLFAKADSNWITVMAGTNKNVIHAACASAHEQNNKVMLDLIDSREHGQSALEAKNLGADALLLHQPYDSEKSLVFLEKWEMIRGNTELPIFISAPINRDTIENIIKIKPDGIILGRTIINAENPRQEAQFYHDICRKN